MLLETAADAITANRILRFLLPLVGIVYPVLQLAPALYAWKVQHGTLMLYRELHAIEADFEGPGSASKTADVATQEGTYILA